MISTVATALAASVMDAMRDDDREKGFTEKYVDNVKRKSYGSSNAD